MQVWPKNDEMRKILRHPNKVKFQETGSAEWPDDSFTYRRIQDGDVVLEDPAPEPVISSAPPAAPVVLSSKSVEKKTTDFKTSETKPFDTKDTAPVGAKNTAPDVAVKPTPAADVVDKA